MTASSFLPAATKMIYDMGLQHLLQGVTFECPAEAGEQPKLVRCLLEGHNYSSTEIDKIFSASKAQGKSLYYVDEALLQSIAPDIIFTQDVCEVCQIDTACTAAAVANLPKQPQVIPLTPNNLEDVFNTAVTIATALGREEAAYTYLAQLQQRMDAITDKLRQHRSPLRRISLMEWIAPIYNCGHWIPFQVAAAGGTDMLGNPGGDSIVTPWEKMVKYNPRGTGRCALWLYYAAVDGRNEPAYTATRLGSVDSRNQQVRVCGRLRFVHATLSFYAGGWH